MKKDVIILGTRGSRLALAQSRGVLRKMSSLFPGEKFVLRVIKTLGDKITATALSRIGGKGIFVKEIENALRKGRIDLAVHSMKDLPTFLPAGLILGAVPRREDCRDVLISKKGETFFGLPALARVGTGSLRRQAFLRHARPDLEFVEIRGNLDTRLKKLRTKNFDALVLAAAGLKRLKKEKKITQFLPVGLSLPAVGQGALGIEVRQKDEHIKKLVAKLDHAFSHAAVLGERAFLRELQGGCQVPLGAYAVVRKSSFTLRGAVASLDGTKVLVGQTRGAVKNIEKFAILLARKLKKQGAAKILSQIRLTS